MACFSARCLETLIPLGCRAYLHCWQINTGSGRFNMSPSLCNFCSRSFSFIKLHACLLWTAVSLAIVRQAARACCSCGKSKQMYRLFNYKVRHGESRSGQVSKKATRCTCATKQRAVCFAGKERRRVTGAQQWAGRAQSWKGVAFRGGILE